MFRGCGVRCFWRHVSRLRIDTRRVRRHCENGEQCECRSGAELEHTDLPGRNLAFGNSIVTCLACELLGIECDQIPPLTEQCPRRRLHVDQLAVGGEHGGGADEIGEQTARAVGQGKVARSALGRHDQYCGGVVGKRQARAQAYQHTTERGAETAQAFKPWGIRPRERRDEARDLG